MAIIASPEPISRLQTARNKFGIIEKVMSLRSNQYLEDEDVEHIPSNIPSDGEELTAFMQQLFQYGLKKWLPGCPVRINRNVLSARLDGVQFRKAQEIRQLFEKNGIRNYINEKDGTLYRLVEQNVSSDLRGNSYIEFVQEEGRDFYHVPSTQQVVGGSGLLNIYQSIVMQGRHDRALNQQYDTFMAHVKERNEVRRREFITNRTQLNSEYIQHVVNTLTIPFEHLNNPELVDALKEAGLVAFIKQPKLTDLVSNEIMVDVFSAPSEEDETWRIMPVTPEIIESSDERIYHGQGAITAYDPTSTASKNGVLPYIIQHCLRAGANMDDFFAVLPEDFRRNLGICNEIYLGLTGDSSESLNKEELELAYRNQSAQQSAQEAILDAGSVSELVSEAVSPVEDYYATEPVVPRKKGRPRVRPVEVAAAPIPPAMSQEELDRLIRETFAQPVPAEQAAQEVQSTIVDTLTEQLLAQMQQGARAVQSVPEPERGEIPDIDLDGDDELPFEHEPAVEPVVTTNPVDDLVASLQAQMQQQAQTQMDYHSYYGRNPIFVQTTTVGAISSYVAFRGQESQQFNDFEHAAAYVGLQPNESILVYNYVNRHREAVGTDVVYPMTNRRLI